jgi:hypothetical protein
MRKPAYGSNVGRAQAESSFEFAITVKSPSRNYTSPSRNGANQKASVVGQNSDICKTHHGYIGHCLKSAARSSARATVHLAIFGVLYASVDHSFAPLA